MALDRLGNILKSKSASGLFHTGINLFASFNLRVVDVLVKLIILWTSSLSISFGRTALNLMELVVNIDFGFEDGTAMSLAAGNVVAVAETSFVVAAGIAVVVAFESVADIVTVENALDFVEDTMVDNAEDVGRTG